MLYSHLQTITQRYGEPAVGSRFDRPQRREPTVTAGHLLLVGSPLERSLYTMVKMPDNQPTYGIIQYFRIVNIAPTEFSQTEFASTEFTYTRRRSCRHHSLATIIRLVGLLYGLTVTDPTKQHYDLSFFEIWLKLKTPDLTNDRPPNYINVTSAVCTTGGLRSSHLPAEARSLHAGSQAGNKHRQAGCNSD